LKQIPNLVSCFRIVLSLALLLLVEKPMFFIVVYLLCGLSDAADGYLARKLDAETVIGTKLDSFGDFIFYAVCLFLLIVFTNSANYSLIIASVIIIAVIRTVNLIITKTKFKQWNIMHTIGNKFTGIVLFTMLPIHIFADSFPHGLVIAVCMVAAISSVEEGIILLKTKKYNANKRSIVFQDK